MMQATNGGVSWQRDDQGTITWWDGQQWVWWDPNLQGPRPPHSFFEAKKKRRVFTWVILVINLLFLIWIISALASASENCSGLVGSELDACETGTAIGATIGVGIIVAFWAFVDVILGVIWMVTRRS